MQNPPFQPAYGSFAQPFNPNQQNGQQQVPPGTQQFYPQQTQNPYQQTQQLQPTQQPQPQLYNPYQQAAPPQNQQLQTYQHPQYDYPEEDALMPPVPVRRHRANSHSSRHSHHSHASRHSRRSRSSRDDDKRPSWGDTVYGIWEAFKGAFDKRL